jgi:RNA polymerase sigma factor for flagellar operon FliA
MSAVASSNATVRENSQSNQRRFAPLRCREPAPRQGALEKRNQLLVGLLPQVRYIARRIHDRLPSHVPFEDVYQTGVLGLIDALKKFDPRKKVHIQSYMKFRIRGAILDGLRELDWSPRELRKNARQIERVEQGLRAELGRHPSETEIAAGMGVSLVQLQHLVGELRGLDLSSLQDIVTTSEDGVEQELSGRLAAPREEDPYHQCAKTERKNRLARAIEQLPEKESQVLALYYYEELTMKEIGRVLSVGESRVSQIHSLAMLRLRSLLGQSGDESANGDAALISRKSRGRACWPGIPKLPGKNQGSALRA